MNVKRYIKTILIVLFCLLLSCKTEKKEKKIIRKQESPTSVIKENTEKRIIRKKEERVVSKIIPASERKQKNEECAIPERIRLLGKNLQDWSFIEETDLSIYISNEIEFYPKRDCYSFIENDFTNDDESDFICIMKNTERGYYLVAFNNYQKKLNFIEIKEATDYAEYGLGDIIYFDSISEGFFSKKLESSTAHIVWKNNAYKIMYND